MKQSRQVARKQPPLTHIGIETQKKTDIDITSKTILDSKTILNSTSELKAIRLNTAVS